MIFLTNREKDHLRRSSQKLLFSALVSTTSYYQYYYQYFLCILYISTTTTTTTFSITTTPRIISHSQSRYYYQYVRIVLATVNLAFHTHTRTVRKWQLRNFGSPRSPGKRTRVHESHERAIANKWSNKNSCEKFCRQKSNNASNTKLKYLLFTVQRWCSGQHAPGVIHTYIWIKDMSFLVFNIK